MQSNSLSEIKIGLFLPHWAKESGEELVLKSLLSQISSQFTLIPIPIYEDLII